MRIYALAALLGLGVVFIACGVDVGHWYGVLLSIAGGFCLGVYHASTHPRHLDTPPAE